MKRLNAVVFAASLFLLPSAPLYAAPVGAAYVWRNVAIGGGGYVLDVYCSPKQKNLVYIRTDVGGFYRWNPKRESWTPILDRFGPSQSNYYGGEGMAVDPDNAEIVYAAAGKYEYATPGSIFKSTDEGRTWRKLPIDVPMGGNEDHRWGGQRLAVSAFDDRILLFGSRQSGLWRSADGGDSWRRILAFPKPANPNGITAIAFSAKTPGEVFAAGYGAGVYESTDNGLTWRPTSGGPSRVERLAASGDGSIYATHQHGVAKFAHGAWLDVTPGGAKTAFGGVAVDPHNPSDILVAGQTDHLTLYRSLDAGATWTLKTYTVHTSVPWYSDQMKQIQYVAGVAFDPFNRGKVWLTDWYATYETPDIDADPIALYNHEHGHEELVAFTELATPTGPPLLSGTADVDGFVHTSLNHFPKRGLGSYYHGSGPSFGDTDSFAWCVDSPQDVARVGLKRWDNSGDGTVSSDGGLTWKAFASWNTKAMPSRIAMNCSDPKNMVVECIAPAAPVYTKDGGASWAPVSGLPGATIASAWDWSVPLAADGAIAGRFYCLAGGTLYRSDDGGAHFAPAGAVLPSGDASIIETDPGHAGELWIALGKAGLLRSLDGGRTTTKVPGIANAQLFAVGKGDAIYVLGESSSGRSGIFRSLDHGRSWQEIDDPAKPIGDVPNSMAASFKTFGLVFVGTNGRGIYYGEPKKAPSGR